ncbi:MAG TPA: aldehyde dehydrogenase (NADP(+)) [Cyclobacteriaceae bacterium]|nr:aldehyde dehydrogenase (NADP(+)) [Cyclobacteriaceae bacterium]
MELNGQNFLGRDRSRQGEKQFQATNPSNGEKLLPFYFEATQDEIDKAVQKAAVAFPRYRKLNGETRALLLLQIGEEIMKLGEPLIARCCRETGLPDARITGERGRTVNQLGLFAGMLKEGSWVDARIDTADPGRKPAPKPDIRSMHIALGPVGIFGASNFPIAFSVAGGDTASALAAGCTVVVKAHPAHPGTCEMVAGAIHKAIERMKLPDGIFSMVQGASAEVGISLVRHPGIKAIGFTGSSAGGKALFDVAASRPEPIPVFAEMGSVNPVFILPGIMAEKGAEIAEGLAASVTLGSGQFCTNPGLFITEGTGEGDRFRQDVGEKIKKINAGIMLTSGISKACEQGILTLEKQRGVKILAKGAESGGFNAGTPYVLLVSSENFITNDLLEKEVFGPSTLAVTAAGKDDLVRIAEKMQGNLTATIYGNDQDLENYAELISVLENKVGRLIINGFPTGVEVCHSMVHGGPFPTTTDARSTSVGTAAIYRFARRVCYQNFPDRMLPDELKEKNPLGIWRLYNGEWKK